MPNPFSGLQSIEEITNSSEKGQILTGIIQFVHHYARHI